MRAPGFSAARRLFRLAVLDLGYRAPFVSLNLQNALKQGLYSRSLFVGILVAYSTLLESLPMVA